MKPSAVSVIVMQRADEKTEAARCEIDVRWTLPDRAGFCFGHTLPYTDVKTALMRLSRAQIIGAIVVLGLIWLLIIYRLISHT